MPFQLCGRPSANLTFLLVPSSQGVSLSTATRSTWVWRSARGGHDQEPDIQSSCVPSTLGITRSQDAYNLGERIRIHNSQDKLDEHDGR
jgi:hypothetical protein